MSKELYEEASKFLVGGVDSPVRAAVRPYPFFVKEGVGPYIITEDNEKLVDYVLGYGPLILGHANEAVKRRVIEQIERGWLYGTPTRVELELAKKVVSYVMPGGKVRFVNSGTEATMTAIRLARGFTGRNKIMKFDGCYHGAHDYVLVQAGSAASEYGVPNSRGVPPQVAALTVVAKYNDLESADRAAKAAGDDLAAIIVEPVIGNMGVIPPDREFLRGLREIADRYGSLLIFDEVITGFRLSMGGAQQYFGVKADIVTLGKIIGGGFPIGAVTARSEIMDLLSPRGPVFNAGTFNANPVTMSAGLATIETIEATDALSKASKAAKEIAEYAEAAFNGAASVNRVESMFQLFFTQRSVVSPDDARASDREKYAKFHELMRKYGVFVPPSQFESQFTSAVHDDEVILTTEEALRKAASELK
ncbi:glutamate-1-semialdehyde 2,1-aminomutase [Acidilobus saccharovorans]|nr:glutamate-1-semialdehyde 2,1-aminomutase [Acidilobus saccharovorans]